ncbi:acylneuraminate cytidylyltransferase family protein [Paenibacillus sp. FSL W7-1287]|uniref:acylneuraminate cytidylyltransferase family protein n=1 Tax=Paenibacillus sp. FSL W7-1287 TaxID=2954538 RepID=UPI0030F72DEC
MISNVLAVITARGGSKGVPRKNVRNLGGKPLIAWTIEEAQKSKYITKLILSSEDKDIIDVAKQYGCEVPFIRPLELAQDDTLGIDVVIHAMIQCPGYDYVILLQPTSPLRTVKDIDGCIEYMFKHEADYCVSVKEAKESPYWMYNINGKNQIRPLIKQEHFALRRQELPPVYLLNGAVYVAKCDKLLQSKSFLTEETLAYVMPEDHSHDIDSEMDFAMCEYIINTRK